MSRYGTVALSVVLAGRMEWALAQDLRIEHVTVVSPETAQAAVDADVTVHAGRVAGGGGDRISDTSRSTVALRD